jgi:hypothetical protein
LGSVLPVLAIGIIKLSFLGIFQDFIGLIDFLELSFGIFVFVDIWVIRACTFTVGAMYLLLRRVSGNSQYFVIIDKLHNVMRLYTADLAPIIFVHPSKPYSSVPYRDYD